MSDFKAKYEVDDGYAGGSRPQAFTIREGDYDFAPDMTDEFLEEMFCEAIDEHMRQHITFHKVNLTEFIAWARKQIEAGE